MSILHVHAAIRTLLPSGITHHEGQAPDEAAPPWLVSGFATPDITLSEAATATAKTGELTVTVSTLTEDSTNFWAAEVDAALLGKTVAVAGWSVGALTPGARRGPYPAGMTALDTDLKFQVARLGYRFTYSRTPA